MQNSSTPSFASWREGPFLKELCHVFKTAGIEARFVGGCVRDSFLNLPIKDIDIAINCPPQQTMKILQDQGITCLPIGIDHGTVMAIGKGESYEITSLRQDVETDGRRAKVIYTNDWLEDAKRRDFTINALYLDMEGSLYDPFQGLEDLKAGRICFIGNPHDRLREDHLRLLRFFRFYAWYGKGEPDQKSLKACIEAAPLIKKLSKERVWAEFKKLLIAPNPLKSLTLLEEHQITNVFFISPLNLPLFANLLKLEDFFNKAPDPLRRLISLLPSSFKETLTSALNIQAKLSSFALSKKERDLIWQLSKTSWILGPCEPLSEKKNLYHLKESLYVDLSFLGSALETSLGTDFSFASQNLQKRLALKKDWHPPLFPLCGEDLIRLGMKPGPEMGAFLRSVEKWWIEEDFMPSHLDCIEAAKRLKK